MQKIIHIKMLQLSLLIFALISCGAKDNLVEGMAPESGSALAALGGSDSFLIAGKGESQAYAYSQLYLQKLVETSKLFSYVQAVSNGDVLPRCGVVTKEVLSATAADVTFDYYSEGGTGECRDFFEIGGKSFVTTVAGTSFETYSIERTADDSAKIQTIKLLKNNSDIQLSLGIDRAPKRYVDASITLLRDFMAKRVSCKSGFGDCFEVSSRLVLKVDNLAFSPDKNSKIKFKEKNVTLDFRFAFLLEFRDGESTVTPLARKNMLFIKGTRMEFSKDYGSDYQGKLYLRDVAAGEKLILNSAAENNCGYFVPRSLDSADSLTLSMNLNWKRSPIRSMERRLDIETTFASDQITTNIMKDGKILYGHSEMKNSCSNITVSDTAPFFNNYRLFAY